ncbi:GNAT family N-acetyltransferase [Microvirga terricola]|uniref:N-acetyltransferase n=1 Tax=Microvirga terricola TaxID=2719797 RepID=A0ABX0VFQ4_9HYPH|nr:N-acetyltransferase [Microvirga terricola]NIX78004.1 N-acetyltransferase [Microvirga terricola]
MIIIREETIRDVDAREALLDVCFGPARFQKTCERLREGRKAAHGLSLIMEEDGAVIGTVRLWHISAGPNRTALMLGPIAIDPACQGAGHGARLMREALSRAAAQGHAAVLLVGDAPYYERFGFSAKHTSALWLPGPYESNRFLALELKAGALDGAHGLVSATGEVEGKPDFAALVAAAAQGAMGGLNRAA